VQASSFRGLGFFDSSNPNIYSYARGVSADGSVVVGESRNGETSEAFRWTQSEGMVGLGFLAGSNVYSSASGVSADGSIIVGGSGQGAYGNTEAFRWTQESGMAGLGFIGSSNVNSNASGVSADGSIIVGSSGQVAYGGAEAFRWTQESGMVGLGFFPLGYCVPPDISSCAYFRAYSSNGISADGSVIIGMGRSVGSGPFLDPIGMPFRWTQEGGLSILDRVPFYSSVNGVSANGSVIVGEHGYRTISRGRKAFRWTQSSGMVLLNDRPNPDEYPYEWSSSSGVSADGSIIIGSSNIIESSNLTQGAIAFVWTQTGGMVSLKDTLIGAGLDLSGWRLDYATGISADGFTIVGNGINPLGKTEGWVANLSPEPIPEPLTILGSMAAIAFAAGFERKFSQNKSDEKDPDA
jgi:probable HAF family extracellular repeat protein